MCYTVILFCIRIMNITDCILMIRIISTHICTRKLNTHYILSFKNLADLRLNWFLFHCAYPLNLDCELRVDIDGYRGRIDELHHRRRIVDAVRHYLTVKATAGGTAIDYE